MKYIYGLLTLILILIVFTAFSFPDKFLHVIACNVGQGDAILITLGQTQILVDGGPNDKVLDCLSKFMPFWDKEIEMVVLTHPDSDHFTGLVNIFKNYKIDKFVGNQTDNSSDQRYQLLEKEVGSSGTKVIIPYEGLKLGNSLLYLDILNPSQDSNFDKDNNYSVVFKLHYKNFKGLFTGDMEYKDVPLDSINFLEPVNYLKVPHHGSKNGLTAEFLDIINPQIAVISVGKNSYGHPDKSILNILEAKNIRIERTDLKGNIEVVSDGINSWVR